MPLSNVLHIILTTFFQKQYIKIHRHTTYRHSYFYIYLSLVGIYRRISDRFRTAIDDYAFTRRAQRCIYHKKVRKRTEYVIRKRHKRNGKIYGRDKYAAKAYCALPKNISGDPQLATSLPNLTEGTCRLIAIIAMACANS